MILTTTNSIEGFKIQDYLDIETSPTSVLIVVSITGTAVSVL